MWWSTCDRRGRASGTTRPSRRLSISTKPCGRMRRSCVLCGVSSERRGRRGGRTTLHCLLEHPVDHVWAMSRQQGLYVPHRLLWDVEAVVHVGGQLGGDDLPMDVGGSDGAAHSSAGPVLPVRSSGNNGLWGGQRRVEGDGGPGAGRRWHARKAAVLVVLGDIGGEWRNVVPAGIGSCWCDQAVISHHQGARRGARWRAIF